MLKCSPGVAPAVSRLRQSIRACDCEETRDADIHPWLLINARHLAHVLSEENEGATHSALTTCDDLPIAIYSLLERLMLLGPKSTSAKATDALATVAHIHLTLFHESQSQSQSQSQTGLLSILATSRVCTVIRLAFGAGNDSNGRNHAWAAHMCSGLLRLAAVSPPFATQLVPQLQTDTVTACCTHVCTLMRTLAIPTNQPNICLLVPLLLMATTTDNTAFEAFLVAQDAHGMMLLEAAEALPRTCVRLERGLRASLSVSPADMLCDDERPFKHGGYDFLCHALAPALSLWLARGGKLGTVSADHVIGVAHAFCWRPRHPAGGCLVATLFRRIQGGPPSRQRALPALMDAACRLMLEAEWCVRAAACGATVADGVMYMCQALDLLGLVTPGSYTRASPRPWLIEEGVTAKAVHARMRWIARGGLIERGHVLVLRYAARTGGAPVRLVSCATILRQIATSVAIVLRQMGGDALSLMATERKMLAALVTGTWGMTACLNALAAALALQGDEGVLRAWAVVYVVPLLMRAARRQSRSATCKGRWWADVLDLIVTAHGDDNTGTVTGAGTVADITAASGAPRLLRRLLRQLRLHGAGEDRWLAFDLVFAAVATVSSALHSSAWAQQVRQLAIVEEIEACLPLVSVGMDRADMRECVRKLGLAHVCPAMGCHEDVSMRETVERVLRATCHSLASSSAATEEAVPWDACMMAVLRQLADGDKGGCCNQRCKLSCTSMPKMKMCGGCRLVRYCSDACQRRAWRMGHRASCVRPLE